MGFIDEQVSSASSRRGLLTVLVGVTAAAADEFLGSYVARISEQDHQASDGYPLDTAGADGAAGPRQLAQIRQRRPGGPGRSAGSRTNDTARAPASACSDKGGAMNAATRRAIVNGEPLIAGRRLPQQRARAHHRLTALFLVRVPGRSGEPCDLPRDLREVGDLAGRGADAREQRQPVGADGRRPRHSRAHARRMNQPVHATR